MSKKCLFCGKQLTDKEKPEHIIPNALGGKLKSQSIICSDCNNKYSYLDKNLCNDLQNFTAILRPHRDNGKIPETKCKVMGQNAALLSDGSLHMANINTSKVGGNLTIHLQLMQESGKFSEQKNKQKIVNLLKNAIKDPIKREEKLKEIDRQIKENTITIQNPIISNQCALNTSGTLTLEMLKIATEFYALKGFDIQCILNCIDIVIKQDIQTADKQTNYFYPQTLLQLDDIYHIIILQGDTTNKLLYAIISLYGILNMFVLLNQNYNGQMINETYVFSLRESQNKNIKINIPVISRREVNDILSSKCSVDNIKISIGKFLNHLVFSPKNRALALLEINKKLFDIPAPLSEKDFNIDTLIGDVLANNTAFKQLYNRQQDKELNYIKHNLSAIKTYDSYVREFQARRKILAIFMGIVNGAINSITLKNIPLLKQIISNKIDSYTYDDEYIKNCMLSHKDFLLDSLNNL